MAADGNFSGFSTALMGLENGEILPSTGLPTEMSCTLFGGDESKCNAVVGVKKAMASFSLIGCVFMIFVIWLFRKYTLFVQRLILYLTVAAFFDSTAHLMAKVHPDGPLCDFQAMWLSFWEWVVLLWVSCITFNMYLLTIKMIPNAEKYELIYHFLSWGIALLMSLLPFIGNHYGPAGAWCWIREDSSNATLWRFFIWYGPLFVAIVVMFIAYSYIIYVLKRKTRSWQGTYEPEIERSRQQIKSEIKPLTSYPFIYLALSVFPLVNRIQNAVNPGNPVFALVLLHAMSSPLVGAVNAVVYGLDAETRSRLSWMQIKNALLAKRSKEVLIQEYTSEHAGKVDEDPTPTGATEGDLPGFGTEDISPAYGAEEQSQHAVQEGYYDENTGHAVIT